MSRLKSVSLPLHTSYHLERKPVQGYGLLHTGPRKFRVNLSGLVTDIWHLVRHQVELSRPLYEKRRKIVSQISHFWPLVIEQAPPDIDEYIQPSDSSVLLQSLTSLSVSHFEIENGGTGDPRSVAIRWEFSENEHFEDKVIEKKFWYRHSSDGWAGLVSEPIEIKWKKGKDLTGGLLNMVKAVWDEEQAAVGTNGTTKSKKAKKTADDLTPKQKALKKKIENTGLGGQSFFAWFGFIGRAISAEESRIAVEEENEKRRLRKAGAEVPDSNNGAEDDEDNEDDENDLEIFPEGDTLALAITDDLWPGAIKYFTQAQEQDDMSDVDFESQEEDSEDEQPQDASPGERPFKKVKV
ncbi:nucleosome assembly protein-domain-containing protein [Podospora didyma]|uniref:Nucleosome assembly protein-domain-containing protein n=1 Tax=Podospora didyma TaxID=330526 RepID=A0AAE0K5B3_9PEZI|nr:nucleosome assembly protein-domain-containing protein [Podospora didyma]